MSSWYWKNMKSRDWFTELHTKMAVGFLGLSFKRGGGSNSAQGHICGTFMVAYLEGGGKETPTVIATSVQDVNPAYFLTTEA